MALHTGKRYVSTVKDFENKALIVKQNQKFTISSVTVNQENITSGDMDLNRQLVQHPASTYFIKVNGTSLQDSGVMSNDLLIIDKSARPVNGCIVIAILDDHFVVKKYFYEKEKVLLLNDNSETYIESTEQNFEVWGVVTHIIHQTY